MPNDMNRMTHHYDSAPGNKPTSGRMKGFDEEFVDIVDYILRITYRIWEGKQVGLCYDYYSEDCPVYTLAGMTVGAAEVTQNTLNTLGSFPDRTLHADNIIWGGNDEDGFHTSHLITTEMTNIGDTEYGAATGRSAKFQVIAHCIVKNNRVIEEWLVRDNYSLVEQLGFDPIEISQKQALIPQQDRYLEWRDSELRRVSNSVKNKRMAASISVDTQSFIETNLHNIWNCRMVGDVNLMYSAQAKMHASANRELTGLDAIAQYYLSFLGSFSDLRVSLDYSCSLERSDGSTDLAVRWTMAGKHTGSALFGKPTGATILVLGESQFRIDEGLVHEEWTVFDQLAVMTQIERARLDRNSRIPESIE